MGNIFGIRDAVEGLTDSTKETLNSISKDVSETKMLLAEVTNKTLQRIDEELTHTRVFLTEKLGPEFIETLTYFRDVMDSVDQFLVTSTFTVRVGALLVALCSAYVVHKLRSERTSYQQWQRRKISTQMILFNFFLDVLFCLCLILSFTLLLQTLNEQFDIMWPQSIPFIILIPSLTTLAVLFQHIIATLRIIFTLLRLIPYLTIEYPICKGLDPVTRGSGYMRTIPLLQIVVYIILYLLIPYGVWLITVSLIQFEMSIGSLKCLLVGYGIFYATAIMISASNAVIISMVNRPLWAFQARKNLERMKTK